MFWTKRGFISALLLIAFFSAAAFAVGLGVGHYRTGLHAWLVNLAQSFQNTESDGSVLVRRHNSIFVPLESSGDMVEVQRDGRGGGLAPFADGVILLTHEGRFYYSDGPGNVVPLALEPPDYNFDAYKRDAESTYSHLYHFYPNFRYHDVLIIPESQSTRVIVSYTHYYPEESCYRTVLSDARLNSFKPENFPDSDDNVVWSELYRTEPCLPLKSIGAAIDGHMAGGRMVLKGNDTIYMGSGDYHWDGMLSEFSVSQLPDYDYGKVVEINITDRSSRQFSRGHRNIQGITVDRDGDLYVVEHGMFGGDELNLVLEGRDYGWPKETLGTTYSRLQAPGTLSLGRHDVFERPTFSWLPSVAISSLKTIDGFHEAWDGDLIMATLRSQRLHRIRIRDRRVVFSEPILIGERIRYAEPIGDRIALWTDSKKLLWLSAREADYTNQFVDNFVKQMDVSASVKRGIKSTLMQCRECHSLVPGDDNSAPSLAGLAGRRIGSSNYRDYSAALSAKSGKWTEDNLIQMIQAPNIFAPGTSMPSQNVDDPAVAKGLAGLIDALRRLEI